MKKKILIVEDDSLISTIFKMFLKELGYDLIGIVEDGKEAIRQCEELQPDIILMDVHLGGALDGIQATEIIMRKFDIPVIYISSDTEEETIQRVINTHSYGYLIKPIDKRELGISIELAFYKHQFDEEQKMREKRYRNFITDSPEAIIVVNENGLIEYLNCLGIKLFRTTYIEDIMGLPFLSFVGDDFKDEFKEKLDRALHDGQRIEHTHLKLRTIHDEWIDVRLTGAHIEFNQKRSLQLILRDITQDYAYRRMLAEKANIINNLYDGIFTVNLDGKVKSWNRGCERIFGLKEEEVMNRPIEELKLFLPGQTFEEMLLQPTMKKGNYEAELPFPASPDREYRCLGVSTSVIQEGTEGKEGIVCYVKDITEKKKNESRLLASEQRNRNLINAIPDLLFVLSKEGEFMDYKVDNESLLAVRKETIVGLHLSEIFEAPLQREIQEKIQGVLADRKVESLKYQMDTALGLKWFEARISFLDPEQVMVLARELS